MDNLSVHRSKVIKERLDELSIGYIFNPVYSPEYNPIELAFAMFKKELKNRRLKAIIQNYKIDIQKEIHKVFDQLDILKIIHCIDHSYHKLIK